MQTPTPADPSKTPPPPPLPPGAPADAGADAVAIDAPPLAVDEARKVPFLQQKWVQDVLPLCTSVVLHAGIIALGFATYEAVKQVTQLVEKQTIIPDAALVEGAEVGGIPNPGLGGDPNRASAQDQIETPADAAGWSSKPTETLTASLAGAGSSEASDTAIGVGPGGGFGSGGAVGGGTGEGGGPAAPFGVPGGGGDIGPKSPFMGVSGNAKAVVYVCDATGTMLGLRFTLLQRELTKAVDILKPIQRFGVVFFHGEKGGKWFTSMDDALVNASPVAKQKAFGFIRDTGLGGAGTDPLPGLKAAFAMKPQLIYFLSDGQFNDISSYDQVLAEVKKLNPDRQTKVNTILFEGVDPLAEACLRKLADENGGMFKLVKVADLTK